MPPRRSAQRTQRLFLVDSGTDDRVSLRATHTQQATSHPNAFSEMQVHCVLCVNAFEQLPRVAPV